MRRSERLIYIAEALMSRPSRLFSLGEFCAALDAAKSTVSEDVALVADATAALGLGTVETFPGAAGGVVFWPRLDGPALADLVAELCRRLSEPWRILPGGFLYTTDIIFDPSVAQQVGRAFATRFRDRRPDFVVTVETKGIPLALFTAQALGKPLCVIRRDSRVTEGPSLSINYLSGSASGRIQQMSLPRRALPGGARVLIVDDFLKAGGTARGILDLMAEFDARVAGFAVLVETSEPAQKLVRDHFSLVTLERVDERARVVSVRPSELA